MIRNVIRLTHTQTHIRNRYNRIEYNTARVNVQVRKEKKTGKKNATNAGYLFEPSNVYKREDDEDEDEDAKKAQEEKILLEDVLFCVDEEREYQNISP